MFEHLRFISPCLFQIMVKILCQVSELTVLLHRPFRRPLISLITTTRVIRKRVNLSAFHSDHFPLFLTLCLQGDFFNQLKKNKNHTHTHKKPACQPKANFDSLETSLPLPTIKILARANFSPLQITSGIFCTCKPFPVHSWRF